MVPTATFTQTQSSLYEGHTDNSQNNHVVHLNTPTSIIFDLGDVLFTWTAASPASPLPPETLKAILRSSTWFEYERGNIDEESAYSAVAEEFNVSAGDVAAAFNAARDSLQSSPPLLHAIRELKDKGIKIYAMSNISAPDWEVLKTKATPDEWGLFDRVFTSAAARERKPNLGFYHHVVAETGVDPAKTIFVDDKIENVLSARSLGIRSLVFDNAANVIRQLKNFCQDPVERAWAFLENNKKKLLSYTSTGVMIRENFAQLLILEATDDPSLVEYTHHDGQWNFFQGMFYQWKGKLTTEQFPNDLDTTSLGLTIAPNISDAARQEVMDQILERRNQDGIVQVYFIQNRPRIDPVVCVNVLTLFYRYGRGHELTETLAWVKNVLTHRAYLGGTYYYATAECFLYFLSRFIISAPSEVSKSLRSAFRRAISERFGAPGDALALSMRIIAAANVGLFDDIDLPTLLSLQEEDGRFTGYFYKYGASGLLIGNDGVTTALAGQAIESVKHLRRYQPNNMSLLA
ncbi:hypothetical protein M422DRAFT_165102 [Sphaerobolus stellatus SS14]|uniref:HAD-like protein n=1 Tax=Sphaerobolus stellatus (strain SS14) TaxID=990650 RepID=A0A0C9UU72_SPHS4|nr:hypothetical protein M422DRAFT_165102 [Sphaerobolus stellatus SS14]